MKTITVQKPLNVITSEHFYRADQSIEIVTNGKQTFFVVNNEGLYFSLFDNFTDFFEYLNDHTSGQINRISIEEEDAYNDLFKGTGSVTLEYDIE